MRTEAQRDSRGTNLDAMNDCISDLEISASGGLVLVFSLFDSFSLRHRGMAHKEPMRSQRALTFIAIALSVIGCGGMVDSPSGDDTGESSLPFVACGGDLLGTWTVSSASLVRAPTPPPDTCTGRVVLSTTPEVAGWVTFRGDGTMTSAASVGNDQTFVVPLRCTDASDCNSLQGTMGGAGSTSSISCATSGRAECTCRLLLTLPPAPRLDLPYRVAVGGLYVGLDTTPHPVLRSR